MSRQIRFSSCGAAAFIVAAWSSVSQAQTPCFKCELQLSGYYECIPNYQGFGWSSCIVVNPAAGCIVNGQCSDTRLAGRTFSPPVDRRDDGTTYDRKDSGPFDEATIAMVGVVGEGGNGKYLGRSCEGHMIVRSFTTPRSLRARLLAPAHRLLDDPSSAFASRS